LIENFDQTVDRKVENEMHMKLENNE